MYTDFHRVLRYMKNNLSLSYPVFVRKINMPRGYDGDCQLVQKGFLIRIEKSFSDQYAIEILIHELSHVLSWNKEKDVHGPEWGKAYSRVYRKYLEWLETQSLRADTT